ncbi:MAG: Maf family protein [Lachnospiraceae bacterium]|nr:Maf family protein [Blautia sp.]MDD5966205.1 Maf family protein [Blautia sp.]MDY2896730.1 Maf family protein [Candidatus Limivivens sp.]
MEKIILASSSPRRRELMAQAGFAFEVLVSEADETIEAETPGEMVEVLSERKAAAVAEEIKKQGFAEESVLLVGADTMVAIDGKKLGKPKDEKGAEEMLEELSGRTHQVYTGVTLIRLKKAENGSILQESRTFSEGTDVSFYPLTKEEIRSYIATGEPMDKAGAYGIQGKAAVFVKEIKGDYNNVVGLPIARLYQELKNWSGAK